MKKSNALMLSYIIFLIITLIADIFFEWNGLDEIAIAATVAGCAFALADLMGWFKSYLTNYWKSVQSTNNYVTSICEEEIDTAEEQNEEMEAALEKMTPYLDKNKKLASLREDLLLFIEKNNEKIKDYKKLIEEDYKTQKDVENQLSRCGLWQILEITFITFGFVLFFIVTAFPFFIAILIPHQTIITIVAFVFIMLNYFLKDCIEENTKQKLDKLLKKAEDCKLTIDNNKARFDNLQLIESIDKAIEKDKFSEVKNG